MARQRKPRTAAYQLWQGTLILGAFDGYSRRDVYVSQRTRQRFDLPVIAASAEDDTPPQQPGGGLERQCRFCVLKAPHTEAAHEQRLAG